MKHILDFDSIEDLNRWLAAKGVNTSQWEQGDAKTVGDLWNEIKAGETRIQDSPLLRKVEVVNVIIRQGNRILVEEKQLLGDNRERVRGRLLSEKVKPNERSVDAAIRGLMEELQVSRNEIRVLSQPIETKTSIKASPSYPGLPTEYTIHIVQIEIDNLPDDEFWTVEARDSVKDPVRKHLWKWQYLP